MTVFYAYPSSPESLGESIQNALRDLKLTRLIKEAAVRFRPWPNLSIAGKKLTTEITQSIDRAQIFACDLTYANANVAFELGYAIGRFKRIWISLNVTIENAPQDYKRLYFGLIGAGYTAYENHGNLAQAFINDAPWKSLDDGLLGGYHKRRPPRPESPALLYARPQLDTDAVIATAEFLEGSMFGSYLTMDDPRENPSPTMEWYAEKINAVDATIVHLLADNQRSAADHNVKASFVAGLAVGFQRHVQLLAHTPFTPPVDYHQLLKCHNTAEECVTIVKKWCDELALPARRSRRREGADRKTATLELRNVSMGEPVAENEDQSLDEYFVETTAYYDALGAQQSIFLGRRGTGKTANMIALETKIGSDRQNHVCTIKPVGYEVDGLIRVLKEDLHKAESGFLVESLWKFLVYGELASSAQKEIMSRPVHMERTADETKLLEHLERNDEVLGAPFSQRVNRAVISLKGIGNAGNPDEQRTRISELLHAREIRDLRELLGKVFASKKKVAILIDNLDEPWGPGHEVEYLSELLSGLLQVGNNIIEDFQSSYHWRTSVPVSITVFVRSDIFAHVQPLAVEQDKLPIRRIMWDDKELLIKVINQRLVHAAGNFTAEVIWQKLFPQEVTGIPTKDWILLHSMPRPRDIIYFVKGAIAVAVNRGHEVVTEEDLLYARQKYSQYVLSSVLAEDSPRKRKLEAVLLEFAGAPRTMSATDVTSRIERAEVLGSDIDFYIDLLCDINFIAIETKDGFRFSSDENERRLMREVSARRAADAGREEAYAIQPAFYQALQIE
ncbi:MAG: hypothetical protein Q8Q00_10175 [Dehalococcoidia bacterium]|nr:hypothetical protein [Dehalococcoidia bacterium]